MFLKMILSKMTINSIVYDDYDEAVDAFIHLDNGDGLQVITPHCAVVSGNFLLFCNETCGVYIIVETDMNPAVLTVDTPEYEILLAVQKSLVALADKVKNEKPT